MGSQISWGPVQYVQLSQSIGSAEALAAVNITLQVLTIRSPGPAMLNTIREQTLRKNLGRVVQEGIGKGHWTSSSRSLREWNAGMRGEVGFSCKYDPRKSIRI